MLLRDINLEELQDRTPTNSWGTGTDRERKLYFGDGRWYKIWGPKYLELTAAAVGSQFVGIPDLKSMHGYEVGLYDPTNAGALIDFIRDEQNALRGYITKDGAVSSGGLPKEFVENLYATGLDCGWFYSDLCNSNVVIVDGHHSLIDFDTHLVNVDQFDVEFEKEKGSLRDHVDPYFRHLLLKKFGS